MESLNTIKKGAKIIFIGVLVSKLLGYVYRLIVARIGVEEYGLLSLALAIFGFVALISMLGMYDGLIRYIAYYKSKEDYPKVKSVISKVLKTTFSLSLILAILLFIFSDFIAVTFFHEQKLSIIIKIIAIAIPLDLLRNVFFGITRAFQKVKYEVYARHISENLVKVILTLILISLGFGIIGISVAYVISVFFSLILAFYFTQKKVFPLIKNKISKKQIDNGIILYSLPLLFSNILILILIWTDTFMLGYFKDVTQVGLYNASAPTANLMYIIPYALITLFLPVLTEIHTLNKKEEFKRIYKKVTKWIFLVNIILLIIYFLFSKQILGILFGQVYSQAYLPLIILAVGYFIYHLFLPSINVLMILKQTKLIFINTLVGGILNIILNFILIPQYGIIGAGIATSTSFIVMSIMLFIETNKLLKINIISSIWEK